MLYSDIIKSTTPFQRALCMSKYIKFIGCLVTVFSLSACGGGGGGGASTATSGACATASNCTLPSAVSGVPPQ